MSREPSSPGFGQFRPAPRRTVRLSGEELVRTSYLNPDRRFPLVFEPGLESIGLSSWAEGNRELLERELSRHGALLFRGFNLETVEEFQRFVESSCGGSLDYSERSSPRSQVSGRIYTSTDYPPHLPIFLHNEQSYNRTFMLRILFFCVTPAREGGATPIADVRKVYQRIDPEIRRRLAEEGYLYVRNFGDGFGLSWQEAFQTGDPAQVETYCRANGIDFEWKPGRRLRTRQHRRAAGLHPKTGEPVWFNHLTFFHVTTLEPQVRDALLAELAPEDLPNNTYHADGSPIPDEVVEHLREAYRAETVSFPWQQGDVLMLDNMLVAHGRAAFAGPRKVVVAMAEPWLWENVAKIESEGQNG